MKFIEAMQAAKELPSEVDGLVARPGIGLLIMWDGMIDFQYANQCCFAPDFTDRDDWQVITVPSTTSYAEVCAIIDRLDSEAEGQDRESYSDDQDRENYTVEEDET